eukprot:CAMPEP_0177631726 /NCGR_PEP_ID=MMETSP0447-20121125/1901_1 /TAXON_ID=0 /ORGANISM="Stygamoeba regulata, Strain BSH-02190019" /LENGTH=285 /DNA_ID=CAMNT_0019133225 /DNA_START=38 /DNA_END=895 /DNA_ORIENTATION=+
MRAVVSPAARKPAAAAAAAAAAALNGSCARSIAGPVGQRQQHWQRGREWPSGSACTFPALALLGLAAVAACRGRVLLQEGTQEVVAAAVLAADAHYDTNRLGEARRVLEGALQQCDHADLHWRYARVLYHMNQAKTDKGVTELCKSHARRAVELAPDNFAAHKWAGIALSMAAAVADSFKIRDHFRRAIELNPRDATSHHLLGMWCLSVADLPWYKRRVANLMVDEALTSSYEEALQHFLDAEALDPGFYFDNAKGLATVYERLGDNENHAKWERVCNLWPQDKR